ncbi:MAG: hypothetical protein LBI54_03705 [Lachnospiraceae bacterium]|jgi:hypothetical protein|nr:hypothetical protein [Lachnospiraceae bacterium]
MESAHHSGANCFLRDILCVVLASLYHKSTLQTRKASLRSLNFDAGGVKIHYIVNFPNGHPSTEDAELSALLAQEYGPIVTADEFEEFYSSVYAELAPQAEALVASDYVLNKLSALAGLKERYYVSGDYWNALLGYAANSAMKHNRFTELGTSEEFYSIVADTTMDNLLFYTMTSSWCVGTSCR